MMIHRPFIQNRAASFWILSGVIAGILAAAASTAGAADATGQGQVQHQYDIPASSLDRALRTFAAQAGVTLSANASLTEGRSSPGLSGSYSVAQGFAALLDAAGLQAVEDGDRTYSIRVLSQESAASARLLGKIRVEGEELVSSTEGTGSYTTGAITIGKTAHSLRETPQSISVITRQRIEDQGLLTLEQALGQSTGTLVYGDPQNQNYSAYSRGFPIEQIQRDGVPMAGFTYAPADLAIYDRVEVLRGASGLFNGAGQPGGTVNLVRKRALADTQFRSTATVGSWDHYRVESDLTGGLTSAGELRGRLVAVYQDEDTFRNIQHNERYLVYGRVEYNLTPDTIVTVGGNVEKRKGVSNNDGLPRYANGDDLHLPRSTFLSAYWTHVDVARPEMFAELEHQWGPAWKVKVAATRARGDSDDTRGQALWPGAVDPVTLQGPTIVTGGQVNRQSLQKALDATLTGTFEVFSRQHELVLGANYAKSDTNVQQGVYPFDGGPVDIFNFDPYAYPAPTTPPDWYGSFRFGSRQSGYYGALRISVMDNVKLLAGARVSRFDTQTLNIRSGETLVDSKLSDEVTPYGAVIYDFARNLSFYASYADIFQIQDSSYTSSGKLLPPIVGANYEAGIKGEWLDGALNSSVALFRIEQTNRAQPDPTQPLFCAGSPTGSCSVADGEVRSEGVELELTGRLLTQLEVTVGYTYNTSEYRKDRTESGEASANQGRTFSLITPKHLFRLWANYHLPLGGHRLSVGTGLTAQSSQGSSWSQNVTQGGYTLWNAGASYVFDDRWSASLNAYNLLDKTYYQGLGDVDFQNFYGEPRNFKLSVRVNF